MSQVSYGTITITDTTDIESIYMIYKGGETNTDSPSINWTDGEVDWSTDITQAEGNYIWAITVYKKSGITITQQNYQEYFSEPVCLTGSIGRSVRSISTYYCNYGNGQPEENYMGWSNTVPVYDEEKPNYWIKTVIIYVDSTEEIITGEGTVVTLDLGDKAGIAKSLKVALEPIQDLNGYDKPWSGGSGKNKLPFPYADDRTEIVGVSVTTHDDGTITFNGTPSGGTMFFNLSTASVNPLTLKAGTYTLSNGGVIGNLCRITAVKDGQYFVTTNQSSGNITFTIEEQSVFNFYLSTPNGTAMNNVTVKPMIEEGSAATSWTPYSNICPISGRTEVETVVSPTTSAYDGETYTTSLGRTVYGGEAEIVGGVLTDKMGTFTIDGTTSLQPNGATANTSRFFINIPNKAYGADNFISDTFATAQGGDVVGNAIGRTSNNGIEFFLSPDVPNTPAGGHEWFGNHPTQVVLELANPQTIQLTPQQVQLLLGNNNVWSDGDIGISGFTIAGQDVTIYKDNGLTEAVSKSFEASSKAQEALDKADIAQGKVTQIDTLLGGHFLWHGSALSTFTKAGARVVEQVKNGTTDVSNTPSQWHHNVNIGANGIQLRYNEAVMAQLAATNSDSSDDIALKFYQPPTIGNTTTQGNLTMALRGNALTFYDPTVANGQSVQAILDADGLTLKKGGIVAGQALTNNFIYLSTEDYPLRQYTVTTDVAINNTKTYYTYNSETQRYSLVDTPDVSQISNYYEISNPGLTVNRHTPGDATNDPAWRQVIGSKFGVDASGTLYASGAVLSDTLTIQNKSGQVVASYGQTTIIGNKAGNQSYIEISDDGISFYGKGQPDVASAHIDGQYMYIPYTVVLNEMQVGQYTDETTGEERTLWSWKKMGNRNLRLVWLGGDN